MRPGIVTTALAALVLIAAACVPGADPATTVPENESSAESHEDKVSVVQDVPYADGAELDVYMPVEGEDWPVVLLLHGTPPPSRAPLASLAEAVASRGVLVMNVGWRSNAVSWETFEGIACSIRFARSNAAEYGGDPDRITVAGYSAGASAASVVALAGDELGGDCAAGNVSPRPNAFVGVSGFYDPAITPDDARSSVKNSDPELYQFVNPLNHLGRNMELDIALVHGSIDSISPVETSTQFHESLTDAGYEATLTILDGVGHGILDSSVETIVSVATDQAGSVLEGNGMGDPSTWSWNVFEEPVPGTIMSDGRRLYGFGRWPEPFGVWLSSDGATWKAILDQQEEVLPPVHQMALSDGHGLVVLESLVETGLWEGVAPEPPTVVLIEPDGTIRMNRFRPRLPDPLNNYARIEVSAAGVGPRGSVIWTTPALDPDAIARAAFGDVFTQSELSEVRHSCFGCDLVPEIRDGTIRLERILEDGSVEQVTSPVPLVDVGIDQAALREGSLLWFSTDGRSWRSVPAPVFLGEGELHGAGIAEAEIVGIEDGFVLVFEVQFKERGGVMYSPDGIDWVELSAAEPGELVPWLGQALLWGDDFWRVTSAGVEKLRISDGPLPVDESGPFVGAGEAGIIYLHERRLVYSPDGHSWGSAPVPKEVSELIDVDSLWWDPPPWVGREAILLQATPRPDEPYRFLQATADNG